MRNELKTSYEVVFALGALATLLAMNYVISGVTAMVWGTALGYCAGVLACHHALWKVMDNTILLGSQLEAKRAA